MDVRLECDLPQDDVVNEAQVMQLHNDVAQLSNFDFVVLLAKETTDLIYICIYIHVCKHMYTSTDTCMYTGATTYI